MSTAALLLIASLSVVGDPGTEGKSSEETPTARLQEAEKLYGTVRKLVGGEHVLLTAAAYVGQSCTEGFLQNCGTVQAGAAAVVSVPLLGVGGGHGADWYPTLQSEDSEKAFERFSNQVRRYVSLIDNAQALESPKDSREAFETLRGAALTMLRETDDLDPSYYETARALLECIEAGESKNFNLTDCGGLVATIKTPDEYRKQLETLKSKLSTYFDKISKEGPPKRHNLLLGPSLGVPVTSDPTDLVLVGAHAEFAYRALRIGVSGGLQVSYVDPFGPPGWYAGLAISGELGDDLLHFANGGLAAARSLQ